MRGWISILVLSILTTPFVVGQSWVSSVSESGDSLRLHRAVELTTDGVRKIYLEGEPREAMRLFNEAIESDSTYSPAHYSLAQILLESSADSAMMHARVAYLSDTTNYWYLNQYAQSVLTKGDYAQSRILYKKLLELRPLDINAYRILALLYQQESKFFDAIALLDTAEVRVGPNPYLATIKRQLLLQTNQVQRALSEARAMVDENPYSVDGRLHLAELYGTLKRDSLALAEYHEAMKSDSTRLDLQLSLGEFYLSRSHYGRYLDLLNGLMSHPQLPLRRKLGLIRDVMANRELYQREHAMVNTLITSLLISHPNDAEAVALQTQHLISVGMIEEALSTLKRYLSLDPPKLEYYRTVVEIERYLGDFESATLHLTEAIERFPEESSLRLELSYMLATQNRFDEAIDSFKSNLDGATDSLKSSIWGTIGDIYHQKILTTQAAADSIPLPKRYSVEREFKKVFKSYERSLKYRLDNVMVLNNYAYFLSENGGDLDHALVMAKYVIELERDNPTYIDTYAWLLYRVGRYEEAKVEMRRAVSLDTTRNFEIALHYAEILAVLGEDTMAEFYWGRSKEMGASDEMIAVSQQRAIQNQPTKESE